MIGVLPRLTIGGGAAIKGGVTEPWCIREATIGCLPAILSLGSDILRGAWTSLLSSVTSSNSGKKVKWIRTRKIRDDNSRSRIWSGERKGVTSRHLYEGSPCWGGQELLSPFKRARLQKQQREEIHPLGQNSDSRLGSIKRK
jgi:hypothetical protein